MLLEVMVAIIIIAVAAVALLKGFFLSLDNVNRVRRNEQAILLTRGLMDDLIIEPPAAERQDGRFSDDPRYGEAYAGWLWEIDVEEIEVDYEERPSGVLFQDTEVLYKATIRISLEENDRVEQYVELETFLMDPDIFSPQAIQEL
jgi:type II secretory pathway pseudopilin PulG